MNERKKGLEKQDKKTGPRDGPPDSNTGTFKRAVRFKRGSLEGHRVVRSGLREQYPFFCVCP